MMPAFIANLSAVPMSYVLLEGATAAGGMTAEQATKLTTSLQSFGGTLLDNFIDLVPPLAVLAAIMFVIRLVKKKIH